MGFLPFACLSVCLFVCSSVHLCVCLSVCFFHKMIEKVGPFHQFCSVCLKSLLCVWVFLISYVLLMCVMGFMDFLGFANILYGFSRYCMIC